MQQKSIVLLAEEADIEQAENQTVCLVSERAERSHRVTPAVRVQKFYPAAILLGSLLVFPVLNIERFKMLSDME